MSDIVERLRGRYPVGEGSPPEFGYRQFPVEPIKVEAADIIESLCSRLADLEAERELIVQRAENAERALVEADERHSRLNIEVSRLYACRDELQDVTRAMDDPAVNNVYSLVDAIHKMKRADAAQECPKGAVSVLNPQGTEETGIDRPAAPIFDEAERALLVARAENAEAALETCDLLRIEAMNACTEANERHSRYVKAVGELAGMAADLAEAEALLREARDPVEHTANGALNLLHTEVAQDLFALVSRIDAHLSRKEGQ